MARKKGLRKAPRRLALEELEKRILFSADVTAFMPLAPLTDEMAADTLRLQPLQAELTDAGQGLEQVRRELIFAHAGAAALPNVVERVQNIESADIEVDLLLLDAQRDPWAQISETLREQSQIAGLHIVPQLQADAGFGVGALLANADAVSAWCECLTTGGTLSLHVDVNSLKDGGEILQTLQALTGNRVVTPEVATSTFEVVFVDAGTPNADVLVNDLLIQQTDTRQFEVILLDPDRDGVTQITDALNNLSGVDAVHVISHGADGLVFLGNTELSGATLAKYQQEVQSWAAHLDDDADLLFYGCNLAATDDGQQLIGAIAELTQADVAASDDLTGHIGLGGDWELEFQRGIVETELAFTRAVQNSWEGLLATVVVDTNQDIQDAPDLSSIATLQADAGADGSISLREAIIAANNTVGQDNIHFSIGTGLQTINVDAAGLPIITDSVILDARTQPGWSGTPLIQLDGSATPTGAGINGLYLRANDSVVAGFIVHSFGDEGIEVDGFTGAGDNNIVQNNWIGIDSTGADRGNAEYGLLVTDDADGNLIGGSGPNDGNIIGGNGFAGLVVRTDSNDNIVQGNMIGVGPDGVTPIGNDSHGIEIQSNVDNNLLGGTAPGEANVIANNTGDGISILTADSTGNALLGNEIYANAGLGIDLMNDGVTANDPGAPPDQDVGANQRQNTPVLSGAISDNEGNVTIRGTLASTPSTTFRIEFFASQNEDTSSSPSHGEAERYLGFMTVATDVNGFVNFDALLSATLGANEFVTAVATEDLGGSYGNSSEFAENILSQAHPIATDDAASIDQDTVLNVAAPGVLANDTDADPPILSSPTGGHTLDFDVGVETNTSNNVWENEDATATHDWALSGWSVETTYASAPVSSLPGITGAYQFSGSGSGATADSYSNLVGNPTDADASFELWFRPDTLTGPQMLFETGGNASTGAAIHMTGATLNFDVQEGAQSAQVSVDLNSLGLGDPTSEFVQVVGVIDLAGDQIELFVNGTSVGTAVFLGTGWGQTDGSGLGTVNGQAVAGGGALDGDVAIFRFYEQALNAGEVTNNFESVAGAPLVVSEVNGQAVDVGNQITLASGALLTLNADGSYSYDPNGQFDWVGAGDSTIDSFNYTVIDGDGLTDSGMVSVTVNGLNETPSLDLDADDSSVTPGVDFTTTFETGGGPVPITEADATVTDIDLADLASMTVTITNLLDGVNEALAVDTTGTSISGSFVGGVLTLTGADTRANYEQVLRTLTYENLAAAPDETMRTISVVVNDGYTDSPAANAYVAINTSEHTSLWISTDADVGAPGADGLPGGWSQGEVIEVGGPTLSLGSNTDGDLASIIDFDVFSLDATDVGGLHYVSRDITAGSGANTFNLEGGDVLVSFHQAETILAAYTDSGLDETYDPNDIVVFRPTTPGDYSDGTFYLLFDDVVASPERVMGFTLVEQNTSVGGTALTAGSLLFTRDVNGPESIYVYATTGVGQGTTSGTVTTLVDGNDISLGAGGGPPRGLELIERATTIGGVTLAEGTILATINADDASVGDNGVGVLRQDIVALHVTSTGVGTTVATAALFFEGTDINLDHNPSAENLYAIALVNQAPMFTSPPSANVPEGTTLVVTLTGTDPDGQPVSFNIISGADQARFQLTGGNQLEFLAAPDFETPLDADTDNVYEVILEVSDGNGGTDTQTFLATVTNVNEAPVTDDVSASGLEDAPSIAITVSASDVDSTVDSFQLSNLPANGTLYTDAALTTAAVTGVDYAASGEALTLYFVPNADWNGSTNFQYAAKDDAALADPIPGTATITVSAVNDEPATDDVSASGAEDAASIAITLSGSDIDGTVDNFTLSNLPANGTLYTDAALTTAAATGVDYAATGESLTLYFVPDTNWNGSTNFQYAAKDDAALADPTPGTATITVSAVNDEPATDNVSASGAEDAASIVITLSGSDVDGTVDDFTLSNLPANGTLYTDAALTTAAVTGVDYAASGEALTLYFVPNADWNGSTNFQYAAKDDAALADPTPGTATITVSAVNDEPITDDVSASGAEDAASIAITLSGSDIDGTVDNFTLSNLPANGTLYTDAALTTVAVTGIDYAASGEALTLYFVPNADWNGSTNFQYAAKDDLGLADATPGTATVTVSAVNDEPATDDVSTSGAEDAASIAITLSGSDVDGTVDNFTLSNLPANGTLYTDAALTTAAVTGVDYAAIGESLTLYFVPDTNWNGSTNFQYAAKDDAALADPTPGTATITVSAVNDEPATDDVSASGAEDAASIAITLSGSDIDGTVDNFTLSNLPANGTLYTDAALTTAAATGVDYAATGESLTLYFVPDTNWNGSTNFQYAAKDDAALADPTPGTATITVSAVNDEPITDDVSASGAEDAASIAITLTGSDVDGTVDNFTLSNLPANGILYTDAALTTVAVTGIDYAASGEALTLYFVPDTNWNGSTNFQYAAKDDAALADPTPGTATITVSAVNDEPITDDVSASGAEDAVSIAITLSGSDIDGTVDNFTLSNLPANGTLYTDAALTTVAVTGVDYAATGESLTLYFVPDTNWNGSTNFQYAAKDDAALADPTPGTATITVSAVNDEPITDDVSASGAEDAASIVITLSGSDVDGTVDDFTLSTLPANGTLYTDAALTTAAVTGVDYAATGESLTLYFVPNADWNGSTNFQYAAKDDAALADPTPGTATITVSAVNDEPITDDVSASGAEDAASIAITLSGSDVDGTVDDFTLSTLPANGTLYTDAALTTVAATGIDYAASGEALTLYFVPNGNWNGSTNFQYAAKDDAALADPTPGTATITVSAVNDEPATDDVSASGAEDAASIVITLSGSDVDGTVDNFTLSNLPANGTLYTDAALTTAAVTGVDYAASGEALTLYFVPNADWNGSTNFQYAAKDDAALADPTPGTATITVSAVNDEPITDDVSASGAEDAASIAITLSGSDVDGTVDDFTLSTLPANGTLYTDAALTTVVVTGIDYAASGEALTLYFAPNANWNGSTNFQYAAKDDLGLADATPGTATVTVSAVNDEPATDDVSASGAEDAASIAITLTGSDVDGTVDDFTLSNLPANGTLYTDAALTTAAATGIDYTATGESLTLYFVPDTNWNGSTNFQYAAKDDAALADPTPGTATITVSAVNDEPATDDVSASGAEDAASIAITLSGSDIDGTVDNFTLSNLPANGTLYTDAALTTAAATGVDYAATGESLTLYFVPDTNWNGSTNFQYAAKDDAALADPTPGTATITVSAMNDEPATDDVSASGAEDAASIAITLSGSDVDGTVDNFTLSNLPANGTLYTDAALTTAAVTGVDYAAPGESLTLYFVPDTNWNGSTNFLYAARDGAALVDPTPGTATITVGPVNDPPLINSDGGGDTASIGVVEATSLVTTVTAVDAEGESITFTITGGADRGQFSFDATSGTLRFTTAPDFETPLDTDRDGVYQVEISATDASGATDVQTLVVTVANANESPTMIDQTLVVQAGRDGVLGSVHALDPDANDALSFDIIGGSGASFFHVDPDTGSISLASSSVFGLHELPALTLELRVTDSSGASATATVTLLVRGLEQEQGPTEQPQAEPETQLTTRDIVDEARPSDDAANGDAGASEQADEESSENPRIPNGTEPERLGPPSIVFDPGVPPLMPGAHSLDARGYQYVFDILFEPQGDPDGFQLTQATASFEAMNIGFDLSERLRQDLQESGDKYLADAAPVLLGTTALSLAFSAGFVTWVLRTGMLFASLLSAAPTLRQLDPLPIFGNDEDDDDETASGPGSEGAGLADDMFD